MKSSLLRRPRLEPAPEPAAPEPADELHAERARHGRTLERLGAFDMAVGAARDRLEASKEALRALQQQQQAAFAAWAARGDADEPAPVTDHAKVSNGRAAIERAELELADAIAAQSAMSGAVNEARAGLARVQARLDQRRADKIVATALAELGALADLIDESHGRLVRLIAVKQALWHTAERLYSSNQPDSAAVWRGAAARLGDVKPSFSVRPQLEALNAAVAEAMAKIHQGE